ncbi:MAG TPA: glycoside hydrolase family 28 protein [Sphingomicrobium sp.]
MSGFDRRGVILGSTGFLSLAVPSFAGMAGARAARAAVPTRSESWVDVRNFGAKGDGVRIDSHAINRAIDHAAARGGGTVLLPAGTYLCYSIRLKSNITLHLAPGSVIRAASVPFEGLASGGYDAAEPIDPAYEKYQDFGHSHWRNSLIWGDGLHDIAITGTGLIHGIGLARDWHDENGVAGSRKAGVGDKAIALKNCRNVLLRDFKVLQGGWFCLLATGVDNLTIDNLTCDTNRDGLDIDCCRNVRVTNCTINSPWDDGICPKSSFALGYARATENLTISDCLLAGRYEMGSVIDGTWKRMPPSFNGNGRIKCGTESNGGFKNITITNCVFDEARGIALETVDGGPLEDVAISNITMRGTQNSPFFLRLGRRMRGPVGTPVGTLKRILIDNLTSYNGTTMPSTIAGVAGHPVEDVKISNVYLHQVGGLSETLLHYFPEAKEDAYPEPGMFGKLPATGIWARTARNLQISNVEVALAFPDNRPAVWLEDVQGADVFNLKAPAAPYIALKQVSRFRSWGNGALKDARMDSAGLSYL